MTRMKCISDGTPTGSTHVEMTPEEEAQFDAQEAAFIAAQPYKDLINQIAALEATITARRRDEAILGTDEGWLLNTRKQIATLRSQLK